MRYLTFMFDAGKQNGIQTFICGDKALDLSKEDYRSFEENHLDDNSIKTMAFSYLTKNLFQDFSLDVHGGDYEL